jgi:hypothetical protein
LRIRFKFEGTGLRLIPEIPNFEVTHLEGRNGIGKSLAVRLLQIVAGQSPYRSLPLAWESLRDQLDSAEICIDLLPEGEKVEIFLTPSTWPIEPAPIHDERLGSVLINGRPASVANLQLLLEVHRVAGDETLAETLAQAIEERRWVLSRLAQRLDERVDEWDTRFDDALSLVRGLGPDSLERLESELMAAADMVKRTNATKTSTTDHIARVRELVALSERVAQSSSRLPDARRSLERASKELLRREETLTDRSEDLRKLLDLKSQSTKTREEVQRWSALLRRRQTVLQRAEVELSNELWIAGVDTPQPAALKGELRTANVELDEWTRRRSAIDQIGPALVLQRSLTQPLEAAIDAGRGGTVVAYVEESISVAELRAGLDRRTHELASQPRPGEIEDIDAAIDKVRKRIGALSRLPAALQKRDRARELYDEAAAALATLAGRAGPTAEAQLQNAQAAVAMAQDRVVLQRVEIANLEREVAQLESATAGGLADRLAALELETGVPAENASAELDAALRTLERGAEDAAAAAATHRTAESRLQSLVGRLALATSDLQPEGLLSWLRPAWTVLAGADSDVVLRGTPASSEVGKRLAGALGRLEQILRPIADMASELRNALTAGTEYLGHMAGQVRDRGLGQTPAEPIQVRSQDPTRSRASLRREIELEFSELFAAPQLRQELFGGAEMVHLDLSKLTVRWMGADGEVHQRPLEAFSSGEQAFSYTLAKLESLASGRSSKYVLLVLDEFGAYVARDRLTQLLSYVQGRALGRIADQVVVVLPLAQDYGSSQEPSSDDTSGTAERIRQVRQRGYFALPAEYLLV